MMEVFRLHDLMFGYLPTCVLRAVLSDFALGMEAS